ncbi:hypothetical protein DFP73DRAFT_76415 [Morchella snyderi]|nr:hypothetical protein DFP73DRAFT_76415 [Morchella snyderi]
MSTSSFPLPNLPSPQSLRLGCLVTNTENLYQEVHEPFPGRPAQNEYETKDQGEYSINSKSSKTSRFTSFLTELLSISQERQSETGFKLKTRLVTTHNLRNHSTWFHDACGTEGTRIWLQRRLENKDDVFMLVGFFIVTDAKLETFDNYGRTGSGIANAPTLPTGGALERLNTVLSTVTAVQRTSDHNSGRISLLESSGEQIIGVWYRKVKFKRLFSRDVGLPSLGEKTRWKALWGWRGLGENVNEEDSEDDDDYGTDIEDDEEEKGIGDLIEVCLKDDSGSEYGDQDVSPEQAFLQLRKLERMYRTRISPLL